MSRYWAMTWFLFLPACSQNCVDTLPWPDPTERLSEVNLPDGGHVFIASRSTGGAAGDKTYKLLACAAKDQPCDVLGTIDSYQDTPPQVIPDSKGFALLINRGDSISGYMNFSYQIQHLPRGSISLRYRE